MTKRGSTKLYLRRNKRERGQGDFRIHGKDYTKGCEEKNCGIPHEFMTKNCLPIIFTEEEVKNWPHSLGEEFVEVTTWSSVRLPSVSVTYS